MQKISIMLIFGGQSVEHEVSIRSARSIFENLIERYSVIPVYVTKEGKWFRCLEGFPNFSESKEDDTLDEIAHIFGQKGHFISLSDKKTFLADVAFPIIHGTYGEDGSLQGLLEMMHLSYVGSGVLGSALGMDKEVMKRLLSVEGIPIGEYLVARRSDDVDFETIAKSLGVPFFVKPASLGSSVGITKVHSIDEFPQAVKDAFRNDKKILFEKTIVGREVECSVLEGKDGIRASVPGEVIPSHEFYSYDAKYLDPEGAKLKIPADLPEETREKIRELSVRVFQILECSGLARVDFFVTESLDIFVNEINTLPGFTSISMYPKLLEATGMSMSNVLDELIATALRRKRSHSTEYQGENPIL
jgi:D-alanine-D-alanine ligase